MHLETIFKGHYLKNTLILIRGDLMRFLFSILKPYLFWIFLSIIIYLYRGQILTWLNNFNRRKAHLKFLQEQIINQYNAKARLELGLNQLRRGNYKKAIAFLEEAKKIEADNSEIYYYLGIAYCKANKTSQAITEFKSALNLKKDNLSEDILTKLGDTYYLQKNYPAAADSYQQALEINPYKGEALYKLGLTNYRLHFKEEAQKYLRKAITEIKVLPAFRYKKDRIWLYKAILLRLFIGL